MAEYTTSFPDASHAACAATITVLATAANKLAVGAASLAHIEHAHEVFATAGYQLEVKALPVFRAVEARWRDDQGETCGAIIAPNAQAACENALAKLRQC